MNDNFEKRLQQTAPREIPSTWRNDILRQATSAAKERNSDTESSVSIFEMAKARLTALFCPAPRAWAGLAIVWAVILVMNLSATVEPTTTAMTSPLPAEQARQAVKEKQLLLAELAGRTEAREAEQPRATSPGPRSQRREETSVG